MVGGFCYTQRAPAARRAGFAWSVGGAYRALQKRLHSHELLQTFRWKSNWNNWNLNIKAWCLFQDFFFLLSDASSAAWENGVKRGSNCLKVVHSSLRLHIGPSSTRAKCMTTISCCGFRELGFLQEKRSLQAEFDEKDLTQAPSKCKCKNWISKLTVKSFLWSSQPFNGILEVKIPQDLPMSRIANVAIWKHDKNSWPGSFRWKLWKLWDVCAMWVEDQEK